MSAPKLFQFPNTVTIDLTAVYKVSHVYFRFAPIAEEVRAFYLKLDFLHSVGEEFYLGEDEKKASDVHRHLIERWAQDK